MPAQVIGCYKFILEYDHETYTELFSNAETDAESIEFSKNYLRGSKGGLHLHIRESGRYMAEVKTDIYGNLLWEVWNEDGTIDEFKEYV